MLKFMIFSSGSEVDPPHGVSAYIHHILYLHVAMVFSVREEYHCFINLLCSQK